jgi:lysophospholipase L1-like esterase
LPRGNEQANAINVLIERAAAHGRVRVAEMRGRSWQFGTLAEDHFHPNERGYASIASAFAEGIEDLVPPAGNDVHTPER